MSKSTIEAVVFTTTKGDTVHNFGILNAEAPFRVSKDGDKRANGLQFGPTNAALLLDRVETDPLGLASALRDYLSAYGPKVEATSPAIVATLPAPPAPSVPAKPVPVASAAPTPPPAPKAEEPSRTATYKSKVYGLFGDVTKVHMDAMPDGKGGTRAAHWKKAQLSSVEIAGLWAAKPVAPAAPLPPAPVAKPAAPAPTVKAPAPAPKAPSPTGKAVFQVIEHIEGDTLIQVTLYLDGSADWKAHNMAV